MSAIIKDFSSGMMLNALKDTLMTSEGYAPQGVWLSCRRRSLHPQVLAGCKQDPP